MSGSIKTNQTYILFLNYEFPPLGGGAATANYFLFKELAKMPKYNIKLLTSSANNSEQFKFSDFIEIMRLNIRKKNKNKLYQKLRSIIFYFVQSTIYSFYLQFKKPFHVTVVYFALPSGITALLLKFFCNVPYIISLRGSDVPGFNERFKKLYPFIKPVFATILYFADSVITNSEDLKNLALLSSGRKDILIIPNGVDTKLFSPSKKKETKQFIFLSVARLIKRKNIDTLFYAVSKVPKKFSFKVHVVGSGDDLKRLQKLVVRLKIQNRIDFKGDFPREEMPEVYKKADAFILTSKSEGMSNAVLEAMASGLPILSTNTGGVKLLLNGNFLEISMKDSEQIAQAMTKIMESKILQKKFSEESYKTAKKYDWNSISKQFALAIESLHTKKKKLIYKYA